MTPKYALTDCGCIALCFSSLVHVEANVTVSNVKNEEDGSYKTVTIAKHGMSNWNLLASRFFECEEPTLMILRLLARDLTLADRLFTIRKAPVKTDE